MALSDRFIGTRLVLRFQVRARGPVVIYGVNPSAVTQAVQAIRRLVAARKDVFAYLATGRRAACIRVGQDAADDALAALLCTDPGHVVTVAGTGRQVPGEDEAPSPATAPGRPLTFRLVR
ncbi:hypothetical protein [Streptomyces canus]|uniref:hypothetical protein n=1 Tax=Streptomyces canus TaxID=58343 RepID=UPI0027805E9F|nr:hypothetical protein [Streptomyces canus]MDQ0757796.1 hypothetical protein [Streptomyces canus]